MKKIIAAIIIVGTTFFLSLNINSVNALVCGESLQGDEPEGVLRDYVSDCKNKIASNQGQQETLAAAINYLDSQVSLIQAEVWQTQNELDDLNREIDDLSTKIESIDYSLDDLTTLFISRVQASYKQRNPDSALALINSSGFADFFRRLEYVKKVRDHDRAVMMALEASRLNYDNQKQLKEEKQEEVEQLRVRLQSQQNALAQQRAAKDKLLRDTQNDEKTYQNLLSRAQKQLAAFSRFVSSQGGASLLSNQTSCDDWGCYYNQRDSQWGNQGIGLSLSDMANYGCLVTSMAMIATHYGKSLTPGQIAASSSPFDGNTALMILGTWSVNGVTTTRQAGYSTSIIDSELAAGRPVIVGIYSGPDHFLVIKDKIDGEYIMNDPFISNGHDIKFTDKYPLSAITRVDRVTVN